VAIGIWYAALDEEVTAMVIQGAATGGVIIVSCVFTASFYYIVHWLNQIHHVEHRVNPVDRRSVKPIGISMEVKTAHMGYYRYPRITDSVGLDHTSSAGVVSDLQLCNDELDVPFIVMGPPDDDDVTDGDNEDAVYLLDHIGGEMMKPFSTEKLKKMSPSLVLLLFSSAVLFLMGLMACKN